MRVSGLVMVVFMLLPAPARAQSLKPEDLVGVWLGWPDSLILQADSTYIKRQWWGDASSTQRHSNRWSLKGDTLLIPPFTPGLVTLTNNNQMLTLRDASKSGAGNTEPRRYKRVDDLQLPASAPPVKPADLVECGCG